MEKFKEAVFWNSLCGMVVAVLLLIFFFLAQLPDLFKKLEVSVVKSIR